MAALGAAEAKGRVHGAGEIACLDVREHGQYGEGHPFLAVPCPYSRLELTAVELVPRASVPIILVDQGDGIAERAATRLNGMGYEQVDWIKGGTPAWAAAGFTLFKGVNLPSKTLGELVEKNCHVPRIRPEALEAWREERQVLVFDGRPGSEYAKTTIPGSRCMPNGELAHRWGAAVADATAPVVVNCAGRTRSIVGAAGLMLTGAKNPIYALENGTQGWALSGRALQHGAGPQPLPDADLPDSRRRAENFARERQIPRIDLAQAQELAREGGRTTYLFDVRSPAEHAQSAHPAAPSAPGGQLVQATDHWIGVRRARVFLADDTGLRASLAAFWLRQLGYEVYVLADLPDWPADWRLERPQRPVRPAVAPLPTIEARQAVMRAAGGEPLLDLRSSFAYRARHLEGARWTTRAHLARSVSGMGALLLGEADVSALAAVDLREAGVPALSLVRGSEREWHEAGLPLVATPNVPSDAEAIDYLFFVHDRHDGNMESARRYLAWETGLTAQLDAQERAEYRLDRLDLSRSR